MALSSRIERDARVEQRDDGVWVVPAPKVGSARQKLRVVGPGRRERGWIERTEQLDAALDTTRRELEVARLVERGSQRLIDRVEGELERERGQARELHQAQARLALTLGALQQENEALRQRVACLAAPAPRARSLWARLLGR